MRKNVLILAAIFFSISLLAQESQVRNVGSFKTVKSGEAIDVYLKKGDKESVKVETTGLSVDRVLTEVSGGALKIHMKEGNYRGKTDVKVYVTYVDLEKISASSASNMFSDGVIKAKSLEIHVSSAANIEASLDAESVIAHSSSAGDITLEGKCNSIDAEASSAGEIDAYNLTAEKAKGNASSAGSIKLNVAQELWANASSGGGIRYRGNPAKSNTNSSSGGSVKKAN
ncbi:MAG TPA: head GIN domain-containing protein [Cyclobacteriaceae bacterium]|nr:head GIN domain-containing protein [Cyclobacteriaceae bacterium]